MPVHHRLHQAAHHLFQLSDPQLDYQERLGGRGQPVKQPRQLCDQSAEQQQESPQEFYYQKGIVQLLFGYYSII